MESTVTGHSYLDMLENFAIPQIPPGFIFRQDGAPPHFHRDVTTSLDETFPGRWVGRGGPTAWPPRSPDLTPLDFFAWGFINRLMPNDPYMGRTAPLTFKRCILYVYSTNVGTEYFKHALYSSFFFLFKMQFVL